jgi:hypothetical protein
VLQKNPKKSKSYLMRMLINSAPTIHTSRSWNEAIKGTKDISNWRPKEGKPSAQEPKRRSKVTSIEGMPSMRLQIQSKTKLRPQASTRNAKFANRIKAKQLDEAKEGMVDEHRMQPQREVQEEKASQRQQ